MFGLSENTLKTISDELTKYSEIEKALIFGSRAKGNYNQGSDIDIAIITKAESDLIALDINGKLNENSPLPYFFDVVSYQGISNKKLKEHIDRVGIIFYERKIA